MPDYSQERVVPYLPKDIQSTIANEIRQRRNGELLNLDRVLLHHEGIAAAWNKLFGTLRSQLTVLDAQSRELAICYVGILNRAEYEVYQHTPDFIEAGGIES